MRLAVQVAGWRLGAPFMTFLYGVAADRSWTGARATIQVDDVLLLPLR